MATSGAALVRRAIDQESDARVQFELVTKMIVGKESKIKSGISCGGSIVE